MRSLMNSLQGIVILAIVLGGAAYGLSRTGQSSGKPYVLPAGQQPTQSQAPEWRNVVEDRIDDSLTRIPTEAPPTLSFASPTANAVFSVPQQFLDVTEIAIEDLPTPSPIPTSPFTAEPAGDDTEGRSTAVPSPTGVVGDDLGATAVAQFQLPPEQVPLSLHPYDHFFFRRPSRCQW